MKKHSISSGVFFSCTNIRILFFCNPPVFELLEEFNTLTVIAEGGKYSFYINGEFQEDFEDNRLVNGNIGLLFDLGANTLLDWEFDDLIIYGQ